MPLDDIPQLDEIDALLDGLSSADTLEVYEKLLPYGNHMVAAAAAHRALSGGGGGGGSLPQDIAGAGDFTISPDGSTTWGIREDGTEFLADSPAPVDADIPNGERRQWFDGTVGAVRFAERLLDGTLKKGRSASIPYDPAHVEDTVVNRTGEFASEWQVFDLGHIGMTKGTFTVTAADSDGLAWGTDVSPQVNIDVSNDGDTWLKAYGEGGDPRPSHIDLLFSLENGWSDPDIVGKVIQYIIVTPRFVRFQVVIIDGNTGDRYAGPNDPTVTFDYDYTAG